jgi:hypothetical protein
VWGLLWGSRVFCRPSNELANPVKAGIPPLIDLATTCAHYCRAHGQNICSKIPLARLLESAQAKLVNSLAGQRRVSHLRFRGAKPGKPLAKCGCRRGTSAPSRLFLNAADVQFCN